MENAAAAVGADSFGQLGTAAVLVGVPDIGQTRTFTQVIPLVAGGGDPAVAARKLIFQNAVCWLLDCTRLVVISLSVEEDRYEPDPPRTGEPLLWTVVVRNHGETPATGVGVTVRLAEGLGFIGAETPQGTVSTVDGVVRFQLGRLGQRGQAETTLTLRPLTPGPKTNHFEFVADGLHVGDKIRSEQDIVFEVVGDLVPVLSIDQISADKVRLKVLAQPGSSYVLERSADPAGVGPIRWTSVSDFVFAVPSFITTETIPANSQPSFYRVRKR